MRQKRVGRGHQGVFCTPMTEMTIMMQAPTWMTRRLPTRVSCSAPMFSLYAADSQRIPYHSRLKVDTASTC